MALKAIQAGVEKILVDTVVIDIPTLGLAVNAINRIKNRYGYPSGCGAHNAISSWKNLRNKYSLSAVATVLGVVNALPIAAGADFVFYGPMRNAEAVYPSIAMIDVAYSQLVLERREKLDKDHPRYKIG
jgi:tetrahydromethanopterin S-methyltransferase subunit H